jgi:hypothetical protein
VSFTWAGTSWSRQTADVGRLVFDPRGALIYWQLAGFTDGLSSITAGAGPDIYLDPFAFLYTLGPGKMFEGRLLSSSATVILPSGPLETPDPSPVPEPTTVALVGSGVATLVARRVRSSFSGN